MFQLFDLYNAQETGRLPSGAGASRFMTEAEIAAVTLYGPDNRPLPVSAFSAPGIDFGPGVPLTPRLEGDVPPRGYQYLPGFNLIPQPRTEDQTRTLRADTLRYYSYADPYARICIDYRKVQMAGRDWDIVVKDDPKSQKAKEKYSGRIKDVKAFFEEPCRFGGMPMSFSTWVKELIEEMLVLDAVVLFVMPNKGGGIHSLIPIDGATIKPNIDRYGNVISYQQILYGYPSSMYAAFDAKGTNFSGGSLFYLIHNPVVNSTYGTSPLEELLPFVQLAMSRISYQIAWYTDGTIPDGFVHAPQGKTEPKQIKEWQDYFDNRLSGNDRQRHKVRFIPFGATWTAVTKGLNYSKDEEEACISAHCAKFGVPRSLFVSQVNRATAEVQRDEAQDTGLKPISLFIADFLDEIIFALGEDSLKWQWVDQPAGNVKEIAEGRMLAIQGGWLLKDEIREEIGLEPLPKEEIQPAAPTAAGTPQKPGAPPPAGVMPGAAPPSTPKAGVPAAAAPPEQMKAERAIWRRFALNRFEKGRHADEFKTTALAVEDAVRIQQGLAKAATVEDVRAVFEKADKRAAHEAKLAAAFKAMFEKEKKAVLAQARRLLPDKEAAA